MAITFAAGAYLEKAGAVTSFDGSTGSTAVWFCRSGRPGGISPVFQGKTSPFLGSAAGINMFLDTGAGATQDKLGIQIKNNSGSQVNLIYCSPQVVFDGNWHLASMNWNQGSGAACDLFLDGTNKASANNSSSWAWSTQSIRYARSVDSFWGSFDGQLAHGCWWNEQLNDMEHYLLGCGVPPFHIRPAALIMYLPMDDFSNPLDYARERFAITTSGTLTRSVSEPFNGPLDEGFTFDKQYNAERNSFTVSRGYKVFRTGRV